MRKVIVGAMVSMDGVMQAPGGPTEDPTKGFKFGGWEMPYFDQAFGEELDRVFKEKFDLLLAERDRKSTRLNSSHSQISYAVFCLKKKTKNRLPWREHDIVEYLPCFNVEI